MQVLPRSFVYHIANEKVGTSAKLVSQKENKAWCVGIHKDQKKMYFAGAH